MTSAGSAAARACAPRTTMAHPIKELSVSDPYANTFAEVSAPADRWATVTPSDANDLDTVPKALRIGSAGNVKLAGSDGVAVMFSVSTGEILPLRARRVHATGTTATGIVALY